MIQLPFTSTIEAQPQIVTFLTINTMVRKIHKNDRRTGSCAWTRQHLDKGGGGNANFNRNGKEHCPTMENPLIWFAYETSHETMPSNTM